MTAQLQAAFAAHGVIQIRFIGRSFWGQSLKLKKNRAGERVEINKKPVSYSFWPTKDGEKGNASIIPTLFSLDPWAIISLAIKEKCPASSKDEALACMLQARDFYESATEAGKLSSRPLTLYYCFMNLAKSLCLTKAIQQTFDKAQHGLSEQLDAGGVELEGAYLDAYPSPNTRTGLLQNFAELAKVFGASVTTPTRYNLPDLIPQIVPGHRLWAYATENSERFVSIYQITPMFNRGDKDMWLDIKVVADDLSRLGLTQTDFLSSSGFGGDFELVRCNEKNEAGRGLVRFQQRISTRLTNTKYANFLSPLFRMLRNRLWVTVASIPPYRRYYAYLCPPTERVKLIPQLLSIYAVSYYLGSITRYRPHHFDAITSKAIGPRVQDFITGQPLQYLYLIASEFAEQEITRPSLV
jgi:YaaC-like Protein